MTAAGTRKLDPSVHSQDAKLLIQQFSNKVVGQSAATQTLVDIFEHFRAGFGDITQPVGNALFLGPTGTGKTHVVETFAEALFGTKDACIRVDCAEFQHSHEIAKLLGSPPGYLGHRETSPTFTQERLDKHHKDSLKFSIVLFDEIEKASDAVWNLMLGILDKASLTLGDNRVVNFSKTLIVMTSNVGAREMVRKDIGYGASSEELASAVLEQKAKSAAKAKFSPEFMNRLQHIVMFETLTETQIEAIVEMELKAMEERILNSIVLRVAESPKDAVLFYVAVSPKAKKTLATQGYDPSYGARHLKRAIDKLIQRPLAKLYNSGQIQDKDTVVVDDPGTGEFVFYAHPEPPAPVMPHTCDMRCFNSDGVKICGHI